MEKTGVAGRILIVFELTLLASLGVTCTDEGLLYPINRGLKGSGATVPPESGRIRSCT